MFELAGKAGGFVPVRVVGELPLEGSVVCSWVGSLTESTGGGLSKRKLHSGQRTCSPGNAARSAIEEAQRGQVKLNLDIV